MCLLLLAFCFVLSVFVDGHTDSCTCTPSPKEIQCYNYTGEEFPVCPEYDAVKTLRMNNNGLTALKKRGAQNWLNVLFIDLSNNKISAIEDDAFENSKIRFLKLSQNRLTLMNKTFGANDLKLLDVSYNVILIEDEVPVYMSDSLRILNFKNCSLRSLYGATFAQLPQLEILHLENNLLETLPENVFANTVELKKIFLNDNYLLSLPESIFVSNAKLTLINISSNNITSLTKQIFEGPSITNLTLVITNNTLICNEETQVFYDWLKRLQNYEQPEDEIHCKEELAKKLNKEAVDVRPEVSVEIFKTPPSIPPRFKIYAYVYFSVVVFCEIVILSVTIWLYVKDSFHL